VRLYLACCIAIASLLVGAKLVRRASPGPPRLPVAPVSTPECAAADAPAICDLEIRLVDVADGRPLPGTVAFIPLDEAGQDVRIAQLPSGVARLELRPGRYQPFVITEPAGRPDPPVLHVRRRRQQVVWRAAAPRAYRTRLQLYDGDGRTPDRITVARARMEYFLNAPQPEPIACTMSSGPPESWPRFSGDVPVARTPDGWFPLEDWQEAGRGRSATTWWRIRHQDHADVLIEDSNDVPGDHRYRVATIPIDALRRLVRLPTGEPARGAKIRALTELVDTAREREWRTTVRADLEGHEPLSFEFPTNRFAREPPRTLNPVRTDSRTTR